MSILISYIKEKIYIKNETKISIIGGAGHIGLPLAVKLKNFL